MEARQLYIQDPITHRIRMTKAGIEKYKTRFARVGVQVSKIKTVAEFKAAVEACFTSEIEALASTAKGKNADLDEIMAGLPGWELLLLKKQCQNNILY